MGVFLRMVFWWENEGWKKGKENGGFVEDWKEVQKRWPFFLACFPSNLQKPEILQNLHQTLPMCKSV